MKLKYLIYTITLTSLTACSDFLEPKSQSKYIPKDAWLNEVMRVDGLPLKVFASKKMQIDKHITGRLR